jgi:hypothetical protein
MPRQSHVGASTLALVAPVATVKRVQPPDDLTPEQRKEFLRVVESMPPEWFAPAHVQLLVQYCRHVTMANKLGQAIDKLLSKKNIDPVKLGTLISKQDNETRVIGRLMQMLRITPQSVEPPKVSEKRMRQAGTKNPWEA